MNLNLKNASMDSEDQFDVKSTQFDNLIRKSDRNHRRFWFKLAGGLAFSTSITLGSMFFRSNAPDFEPNSKNLLTYSDIQTIKKENIYGFSPSQIQAIDSISLSLESGRVRTNFCLRIFKHLISWILFSMLSITVIFGM